MTQKAFISAEAGILVISENGRYRLFERRDQTVRLLQLDELSSITRTLPDLREIQARDFSDGQAQLEQHWRNFRATRLYLMLLDPDEPDDEMTEVADLVEDLADAPTASYLRGALSIKPLPAVATTERAARLGEGRPALAAITGSLLDTQQTIGVIRDALDESALNERVDADRLNVLLLQAIESGLFVELIDAIDADQDAAALWTRLGDHLRPFDYSAPLIARWRATIPSGVRKVSKASDVQPLPVSSRPQRVTASVRKTDETSVGEADQAPSQDLGKDVLPPPPPGQRFPHLLDPSLKQLLDAGVHFGSRTSWWNPKMKPYIFGTRNGIHIIDLSQTVPLLRRALLHVSAVVAAGGEILFVGTKRVARDRVAQAAEATGQHFVNHRWLGGTLTNWKTIRRSISRLEEREGILAQANAGLTKREILAVGREHDKLVRSHGGIRRMIRLPDLLFVLDARREHLAISEANKVGVPIVAVLDTDASPDGIAFPVPGNDDGAQTIQFYCDAMVAAIDRGRLAPPPRLALPNAAPKTQVP